jgi:trehalose synthase
MSKNNEAYQHHIKTRINEYEPIVGKSTIEELRVLAGKLSGKTIQNVNSTFSGGGVAEILSRLVPLLNQLGVNTHWNIISADEPFFEVTKKFHNALHNKPEQLSKGDYKLFLNVSQKNLNELNLQGDIFFIHDPQPVVLIENRGKWGGQWLWRCHVDVSNPQIEVWEFLRNYIIKYDGVVFSSPHFSQKLPNRQFLISPSIDPLSDKNRELSDEMIRGILNKYKIDLDKPIILQVSRYDYLKDPVGVIQAFKMVRKSIDCQLILAGGTATDDPESDKVLSDVYESAGSDPDIHVLLIPSGSDLEINALQRAATVILQKSLKEGFGLTITEALWKSKPVVASAVGGIPLQIKNKFTGLLCYSTEGAAYDIKQLLNNREYAAWLGHNGQQHVRQNYLITRHIKEYMLLFLATNRNEDIITF